MEKMAEHPGYAAWIGIEGYMTKSRPDQSERSKWNSWDLTMMWGLIFICGKEREVSMKFYDEQLQKLQEQIARKRQLEAQASELRVQRSTLSARVRELEVIKMPNAVSDVTAQVAVTRAFPYTAQREFPSVAMVQVGSENFPMLRLKNPQQNTSPIG